MSIVSWPWPSSSQRKALERPVGKFFWLGSGFADAEHTDLAGAVQGGYRRSGADDCGPVNRRSGH